MKNSIEISEVRQLLDKYFDGVSTPDDERCLKSFFSNRIDEELPEDLRSSASMFRMLTAKTISKGIAVPDDFEARLLETVESVAANDNHRRSHKYILLPWIGVAAAIAILLTVFVPGVDTPEPSRPSVSGLLAKVKSNAGDYQISDDYYVIEDEEEAKLLIESSFAIIGDKMSLAGESMAKSHEKIDKFNKTLRNIIRHEKN